MTRLLRIFFLPPGLFIEILIVVIWLMPRRPRLARGLAVALMAAIYALSTPLVADALHRGLAISPLPIEQARDSHAQVIVCLASGGIEQQPELGGTGLSDDSLERTYYAVRLQQQTGLPILFTGGAWKGFSIAEPMAEAAHAMGAPKARLLVETASQDTWQNAKLSEALLKQRGWNKVLLVTQSWHMRRAIYAFSHTSLQAVAAPYESDRLTPLDGGLVLWLPRRSALDISSRSLEEWLGLLFYRFKQ